jgi:UDP-glucose 4-epimerase
MTGAGVTLVTGATGFLGLAVLRQLRPRRGGVRVVACVRHPARVPSDVESWVVDLAAADAPQQLCAAAGDAKVVRLVHLAGGYPSGTPDLVRESNVDSTLLLLEALGKRLAHVVHASSVAVYGIHRQRRDGGRFQVAPDTGYGRAKWLAEAALDLFARHSGAPVTILRLASLYGAGNTGHNAVAMLTTAVARRQPFVVDPTTPVHARDYLHVDDAARAVVAAALDTAVSGAFDVGTGVPTSPYDLVAAVRERRMAVDVRDRQGAPLSEPGAVSSRFACDPSRAAAALGLPPPTPLADGVADELAWRLGGGGGTP